MNKMKTLICVLLLSASVQAEQRIISAGGSVTEILYALGLGDQIVAVDSSSYFPHEAAAKPKVGYFRTLAAEGVLSMKPELLVASGGAGPEEAIEHIKNQGVTVKVMAQEAYDLDSWRQYILDLGAYFNRENQAQSIVNRVDDKLASLTESPELSVLFLMSMGDRGPIAAGTDTVPDMLFQLAGMKNVVSKFSGYKPLSTESLIGFQPDLIVMPSHNAKALGDADTICQIPSIKLATAAKGCQVMIMDALLALGYGTRIDQAVEQLHHHAK